MPGGGKVDADRTCPSLTASDAARPRPDPILLNRLRPVRRSWPDGVRVLCADVGEREVRGGAGQVLVRQVADDDLVPRAGDAPVAVDLDRIEGLGIDVQIDRLTRTAGRGTGSWWV